MASGTGRLADREALLAAHPPGPLAGVARGLAGAAGLAGTIAETTAIGWLLVLYTTIFPSVISQMLYVRGVELIGANRASLFINLIPLFGAVGSVLLLGEALQPFHLLAGGLIVVGIVLAEWAARRAPLTISEP